jgi:hypothetical protein
VTGKAVNAVTLKFNAAGSSFYQSTDAFQGGAFTRTIRPDQGHAFRSIDLQVDAMKHIDLAVASPQIFDL